MTFVHAHRGNSLGRRTPPPTGPAASCTATPPSTATAAWAATPQPRSTTTPPPKSTGSGKQPWTGTGPPTPNGSSAHHYPNQQESTHTCPRQTAQPVRGDHTICDTVIRLHRCVRSASSGLAAPPLSMRLVAKHWPRPSAERHRESSRWHRSERAAHSAHRPSVTRRAAWCGRRTSRDGRRCGRRHCGRWSRGPGGRGCGHRVVLGSGWRRG